MLIKSLYIFIRQIVKGNVEDQNLEDQEQEEGFLEVFFFSFLCVSVETTNKLHNNSSLSNQ